MGAWLPGGWDGLGVGAVHRWQGKPIYDAKACIAVWVSRAGHRQWKVWCAGVASAFMQTNSIDDSARIYVKPPSEMRKKLERLMGLKEYEILKATNQPLAMSEPQHNGSTRPTRSSRRRCHSSVIHWTMTMDIGSLMEFWDDDFLEAREGINCLRD